MDVGETVVVGTSRVAGDKALIALLTAVAHAGTVILVGRGQGQLQRSPSALLPQPQLAPR